MIAIRTFDRADFLLEFASWRIRMTGSIDAIPDIPEFTSDMRFAIGKRIRELREAMGYSLEDVAFAMGYKSAAPLSKLELGDTACSAAHLHSLSLIFGVTTDYLVFGSEQGHMMGEIIFLLSALDESALGKVKLVIQTMLEL